MTLAVQPLTEPTSEIEEYLRKDLPLNGLPLYDLTLAWNSCEWFVAHDRNRLRGCLVIYKGGLGINSFLTRGNQKAVQQLISNMPYSNILALVPNAHRLLVREYYQCLTEADFLLMCLEEAQCKMPELHSTERLTLENAQEVTQFYQKTAAGAWNPNQINLGSFHGIRVGTELVSLCGIIGVYQVSPGVSVIGNLVTLPKYQGLGYGTSVLCAVIKDLFKSYKYVTLMVDSGNDRAIRIYERLGFRLHARLAIGVCQRLSAL